MLYFIIILLGYSWELGSEFNFEVTSIYPTTFCITSLYAYHPLSHICRQYFH